MLGLSVKAQESWCVCCMSGSIFDMHVRMYACAMQASQLFDPPLIPAKKASLGHDECYVVREALIAHPDDIFWSID